MKHFVLLLLLAVSLQSCWPTVGTDDFVQTESYYEPITIQRAQFEQEIFADAPRPVVNAGKIYVSGNYVYINEAGLGFHILDNTDPATPTPIAFIEVPGSTDLAIRDGIIYTHHAVDLVSMTYDLIAGDVTILHREINAFPLLSSPDGFPASYFNVPDTEVIVDYQLID